VTPPFTRPLTPCVLLLLAGCYASNVVAVRDRTVVDDVTALAWRPAQADDVPGLYESVAVQGDAAFALRRVYYWFSSDGRYAGAALIAADTGMAFQTLAGTWRLGPEGFVLDAAAPAQLLAAPEHLRIDAGNGVLVLRRSRLL
jgi:hypothetical protein